MHLRFIVVSLITVSVSIPAFAQGQSPWSPRTAHTLEALETWLNAGSTGEAPVVPYVHDSVTGLPEPGIPLAPGQEPVLELLVITDQPSLLHGAGFVVGTVAGNVATVKVPFSSRGQLEALPGVQYIHFPRPTFPSLNLSVPEVNADDAHGTAAPPYPGATGEGVVVGVIDTGLDVSHADFRNGDGSTRVSYLWDQTDPIGPSPSGYAYGSEWSSVQIDAGLMRQRDTDGHGTHVTGIAAGNGRGTDVPAHRFTYTGMAPEAEIIVVKSTFLESSIIDAVNWIQSRAGTKPCVINMSLGSQFGPHDGTSGIDLALNSLSGPGRILVAAAGNEGSVDIHAEAAVAPGTTVELPLIVPAYTPNAGSYNDYLLLDSWFSGGSNLRYTVVTPSGYIVGPVGPNQQRQTVTADGTIAVGSAFYPPNGDFGVEIDAFDSSFNPPRAGTWRVRVENAGTGPVEVDAWISYAYLGSGFSNTRWSSFVDSGETVASPGTSNSVLAVGAYLTKISWPRFGGGVCGYAGSFTVGSIAPFSSLGPRRDGVQKPEISAPGMGIASSLSINAQSPLLNNPCTRVTDGVHAVTQGTSQSAPHVTGAVALVLEGRPDLDFAGVRDALVETARHDDFTGSTWSPAYGHGKLDAAAAAVPPVVELILDLNPGSCPNPLAFQKQGVIPAAVAGTVDLDVQDIDVTTLLLEGVSPSRTGYEDVTEEYGNEDCACAETEPDGIEDLILKFSAAEVLAAVSPVSPGEEKLLTLTGNFMDGTEFMAKDCLVFRGTPKNASPEKPEDAIADPSDGEDKGAFSLSATGRGTVQNIVYELPEPSPVRLTVFDVTGRVVKRLVQASGGAGEHQVNWDTSGQASGIYFYRLEAGSRVLVRKTVVVKR